MFYVKIGISILLLLTAVLGGIPTMINDGVEPESIGVLVVIAIIVTFLLKSAFSKKNNGISNDVNSPCKTNDQSWLKKENKETKIIKEEQQQHELDNLKYTCSSELDPIKKLQIIKDSKVKPYSKIASQILSKKEEMQLRINKTNELIGFKLISENDLTQLTDFYKKEYDSIMLEKKAKRDEKQRKMQMYEEQQRNSPKGIHKANKKKGIVSCPKCASTAITTSNKKLSVTRGAVGGALLGPLGAGVGALTSKKIYCVCMNCGHKWKP